MGLFTARKRYGYARFGMPKPKTGDGPWAEAIRYWLDIDKLTQADLVRLLNEKEFAKAYKGKPVQAKTVSRIVRGFHTQTRLLARIAAALKQPLDAILVAPTRTLANEKRAQLARQISEEVLRTLDARGAAPQDRKRQELWDRITRLSSEESLSNLVATISQMEEIERRTMPPTAAPREASKKRLNKK
jgi:transcriptional regulator with XRE-family HTH domain